MVVMARRGAPFPGDRDRGHRIPTPPTPAPGLPADRLELLAFRTDDDGAIHGFWAWYIRHRVVADLADAAQLAEAIHAYETSGE